jgi:hypothetical protein
LYGYEANLGLQLETSDWAPTSVTEIIANREAHLQLLKQRLEQTQNRMKVQADRHTTDKQFMVGDLVLL